MSALVGRDCRIARISSGMSLDLGEVSAMVTGPVIEVSEVESVLFDGTVDRGESRALSTVRLLTRGAAIMAPGDTPCEPRKYR